MAYLYSDILKKLVRISLAFFIASVPWARCTSIPEFGKSAFAAEEKPQREKIIDNSDSQSSDAQKIDPGADSLLKEMSDFLGSRYRYTFKADIMFDEVLGSGRKLQRSAAEKVFIQKPNKVYIEYIGDLRGEKFWYADNSATILDLQNGTYSKTAVAGSIDGAFDELLTRYAYSLPFTELLFVNPYKTITENVEAGQYIGSSVVFGVTCNHLALVDKNVDWQIWIEDGQRKVPRKIAITYKKIPGSPQFIAVLKDWVFDQPFSRFVFEPDIPKYGRETKMSRTPARLEESVGSIRGSRENPQTDKIRESIP